MYPLPADTIVIVTIEPATATISTVKPVPKVAVVATPFAVEYPVPICRFDQCVPVVLNDVTTPLEGDCRAAAMLPAML